MSPCTHAPRSMNHVYIVRYHACWFEVDEGSARQAETVAPTPTIKAGAPAPPSDDDDSDSDSDSATADGADDDDDEADDHTIFDMDVRAPDLNDFLSSECGRDVDVSYPSIRFGTTSATGSTTASRSLTPAPTESSDQESTQDSHARRTFFMQMEYVDSQTLREAIDRGFDDDVEPWRISRQILQAIVHYVSLHIIHRDLKPSNVFLDGKASSA